MMNSKLILGTVQFGLNYGINNKTGIPDYNEVSSILSYARLNNISYLDTATSYGNSEKIIGKFHKELETKFKINTKFPNGIINDFESQIRNSISRLNVDKINIFFFHSLKDFVINKPKINRYLAKNKYCSFSKLGVSVYTNEELVEVLRHEIIDVVQVSFNIFDNESKKGDILSKLKKAGKEIHARSCFLQGLFFMNPNKFSYPLNELSLDVFRVKEIALKNNFHIGALCMSYVLKKKYIDNLIVGVDSLDQLRQNISWSKSSISNEFENLIDDININKTQLLNPSNW